MSKKILCTLGPASMNLPTIRRLEDFGVALFRINLSHTALKDVAPQVEFLRANTKVPVCLDSEGAQIRTGNFVANSILLRENAIVRACRHKVPGDDRMFNFTPRDIIDQFEIGDFISIDFNSVLVQVIAWEADAAVLRVITGGQIGRNKAVTVERDIPMPALSDKDRAAVAVGRSLGVVHFALSFANHAADVEDMRAATGDGAFLISKIETLSGLANLEAIAQRSDALLIDRGDLSRQVPLEQIPARQKEIIRRAKVVGRPVYVATNLLESMVTSPQPTRAEVNDIYNTLVDGADGLVLAAETAIGRYPVRCAGMVVKLIQQYEQGCRDGASFTDDPVSLLVPPHGGRLVQREAKPGDVDGLNRLPKMVVPDTVLMDCEQIALGTYSPLTGFMDKATLESVLNGNRLPSGDIWTLPVLLAAGDGKAVAGQRVALTAANGHVHALLDVTDRFTMNLDALARAWFGTDSGDHPGVARLKAGGDTFLGGSVTLVDRLPSPYRQYELTPAQTRFVFAHKGWSKVVGFHGRNVCHRVHEQIQLRAMEETSADGLFISPVIGPKKPGDFVTEAIMRSYQILLDFGIYPEGRVVLGSFATYSRYCGPREAVFTALCRKNMGCSHFIIGRDHTGVGNFYGPDANRELFDSLGDLGIAPVFFESVGYDPASESYGPMNAGMLQAISGTQVRDFLRNGEKVPEWFLREEVHDMLVREMKLGNPVFCE